MNTLADKLQLQVARHLDLYEQYGSIGSAGAFGQAVIREKMLRAFKAALEGDLPAMVQAVKEMEDSE